LPEYMKREIRRFFEEYKILEEKEVLVEDFEPAARTKEIILACARRYDTEIAPKIREQQLKYCVDTRRDSQR